MAPADSSIIFYTTMVVADKDDYRPTLCKFMKWRDNTEFDEHHVYTAQHLVQLEEIARWMKLQAYGIPNTGVDDNPMEF